MLKIGSIHTERVDGLLLGVDKPACRPLLFWTWSLVIDDVPPLLHYCLEDIIIHSSSVEDDVLFAVILPIHC